MCARASIKIVFNYRHLAGVGPHERRPIRVRRNDQTGKKLKKSIPHTHNLLTRCTLISAHSAARHGNYILYTYYTPMGGYPLRYEIASNTRKCLNATKTITTVINLGWVAAIKKYIFPPFVRIGCQVMRMCATCAHFHINPINIFRARNIFHRTP